MTVGLLLTFSPQIINASTLSSTLVFTKSVESDRVMTLELRLNEIKAMDKSNMTSAEKKSLRAEVLSIRGQEYGYYHRNGAYVSVGALILIVLLLLILLH